VPANLVCNCTQPSTVTKKDLEANMDDVKVDEVNNTHVLNKTQF